MVLSSQAKNYHPEKKTKHPQAVFGLTDSFTCADLSDNAQLRDLLIDPNYFQAFNLHTLK